MYIADTPRIQLRQSISPSMFLFQARAPIMVAFFAQ